MRDAAGKPTGIVRGDIAGTRIVASKMPRVAPEDLEKSATALIGDMNRVGLTTIGVPGCEPDVLAIFEKWKAEWRGSDLKRPSLARFFGRLRYPAR